MSAVELGFLIQICSFGAAIAESNQELFTDFGMCHLTATEADSDLDAVSVLQELHRAAHFGVQVIRVDSGRHTNLLDFHDVLIFLCFLFLLELVEAELSVVHDPTDRRNCIGRDFNKIELLLLCHCQCFFGCNDTDHCAVSADQSDFLISDFFVELMI